MDFQILKLQETPDSVPHGEMPRHVTLYADRSLCDTMVPGNRVVVAGVYSIRKAGGQANANKRDKVGDLTYGF